MHQLQQRERRIVSFLPMVCETEGVGTHGNHRISCILTKGQSPHSYGGPTFGQGPRRSSRTFRNISIITNYWGGEEGGVGDVDRSAHRRGRFLVLIRLVWLATLHNGTRPRLHSGGHVGLGAMLHQTERVRVGSRTCPFGQVT